MSVSSVNVTCRNVVIGICVNTRIYGQKISGFELLHLLAVHRMAGQDSIWRLCGATLIQ